MKPDELSATLQAHRPPAAKNQIIDQALIALKEVMPAADDDLVRRLRNRLNNDSLFAKAVRRAAVE
jgi:hypothetical protein